MKYLSKLSMLLLMFAFFLTSCDKNNTDELEVDNPPYQPTVVEVSPIIGALSTNNDNESALGCVTLEFPLEVKLHSGSISMINSTTALNDALSDTGENEVVDFLFPINITDSRGVRSQVANTLELGGLYASCVPDEGWPRSSRSPQMIPAFLLNGLCYALVYPVTLQDENGMTYTAADEADFINISLTVDPLFMVFPLTLVDQDGNQEVVADEQAFFDILFGCDDIYPPTVFSGSGLVISAQGCHTLIYPVTVVLSDGSTVTVNDANEYVDLILSGAEFELQFSFSVIDFDGQTVVVNNVEDFIGVLLTCGIVIDTTTADSCGSSPAHLLLFFNQGTAQCGYNVNYPAQLLAEGVTYDINNMTDYLAVFNMYSSQIDKIDIIYPISVTVIDGGAVETFNSDSEICAYILGCG